MKKRYQIDQQPAVQQVPPARHRTELQHPDDPADGRHRRLAAGGCGQLAAARRTGTDAPGDGRRSEVAGWRAPPATPATSRSSLGQGRRLLRGGWPKGADQADATAQRRQSRTTLGELRTVSARRAFAARRLGQDDAGPFDARTPPPNDTAASPDPSSAACSCRKDVSDRIQVTVATGC